MIALRELKTVRHGLHQNLDDIRGPTVKLYQDNMAVVGALRKMSSRCPALMTEIKELVPWFLEHKIRLEVVYIRSEANLLKMTKPFQLHEMSLLPSNTTTPIRQSLWVW
jgi:hypothetical protein